MANIGWDAHSCVPLKADYDIVSLKRHRNAGFDFVSINVGMDMTPIADIVSLIASFRAQIAREPEVVAACSIEDVRTAAQQNKLAVGFDLEGSKPLLANPSMVALYAELGVRQIFRVEQVRQSLLNLVERSRGPPSSGGRYVESALVARLRRDDWRDAYGRRCCFRQRRDAHGHRNWGDRPEPAGRLRPRVRLRTGHLARHR